jgi:putative transposase
MRYTSDLTDTEWQLIDYCFPEPCQTGRPREHRCLELLNGIFHLTKTACPWRHLPDNFAPWGTVYHYFRTWKRTGWWVALHTRLREQARPMEGRKRQASAALIDSQSVKSTETSDERGYEAGKKVNGRQRPILVDTIGLILLVMVLPAHIQDRDGAKELLTAFFSQAQPKPVKHLWAEGGYAGALRDWAWRGGVAPSRSSSAPNSMPSRCGHAAGGWNAPSVGSDATAD